MLGVFSLQLISHVVLFPRIFCVHYRTSIFRNISERILFNFFSLTAMYQTRVYLFVSSKNQTSCTSFLQTELGIYLIHSDVSRNIFPSFSEHKVFYKSSCSARFFFYYANTHLGIDYKYGVWTIAPRLELGLEIGLGLGGQFF